MASASSFAPGAAVAQRLSPGRPVLLVTAPALSDPEVALAHDRGAQILVAGDDPLAMTLADLALPGARIHWANLRQSAEIATLVAAARRLGPVSRAILAPRSADPAETLALMRLVLALLPILPPKARIRLLPADAAAGASLHSFARGLTAPVRLSVDPVSA